MSEKLKPNFTPVPNVIFDEAMRTLAPGAVKVLFAICRYTFGWGKKSDRISLNQLSAMTGMDRANVARSVRQLDNLVIVTPGDPRTNQASEYRINIEISDSDLVSSVQQGLVSRKQQASVRPSVKTPPIQRNTKERRDSTESDKLIPDSFSRNGDPKSGVRKQLLKSPSQKNHEPIVASAMQRLNEKAGLTYKLNSKIATKHIGARINEGFTETDFLCIVDYKCAKWKGDPKMEQYLRPETLFSLEHFESYLQEAKAADHMGQQRGGFVG